jgi:hypothetical protein
MSLLAKSEALYFSPDSIASDDGARCGICWKFNEKDNLCMEVEGSIDANKGICGLYVNGTPAGGKFKTEITQVSKAEAGYALLGPTHCRNCDEMLVPKLYGESRCKRVEGMVEGRGCCSLWEAKHAD